MKSFKDEKWLLYDDKYKDLFLSNFGRVKHNEIELPTRSNGMFAFRGTGKLKQLSIPVKMKTLFGMKKLGVRWVKI